GTASFGEVSPVGVNASFDFTNPGAVFVGGEAPTAYISTLGELGTTGIPELFPLNGSLANDMASRFGVLKAFREDLGPIPAKGGKLPNGGTLSLLDSGGDEFFGINAHGQYSLIGSDFNFAHAEIDSLQQAFMADSLTSGATIYVDKELCKWCRRA